MDALTCIWTRRSVRKYEKREVTEESVKQIIEAGMMAPSAGNQQPWQFIVVTDAAILAKIPDVHPYAAMATEAPVSILVCGDVKLEKHKGFWVQDCSAAIQNMLLAAHALGLGSVWTGIYPREDRVEGFRKLFKLPPHIIPLALLPVGYPGQKTGQLDRFQAERIHKNKW
jgi:nitroreductase